MRWSEPRKHSGLCAPFVEMTHTSTLVERLSRHGTSKSRTAEYLFNEKNHDIRAALRLAALTDTGLQSKPGHRIEAHSGQL